MKSVKWDELLKEKSIVNAMERIEWWKELSDKHILIYVNEFKIIPEIYNNSLIRENSETYLGEFKGVKFYYKNRSFYDTEEYKIAFDNFLAKYTEEIEEIKTEKQEDKLIDTGMQFEITKEDVNSLYVAFSEDTKQESKEQEEQKLEVFILTDEDNQYINIFKTREEAMDYIYQQTDYRIKKQFIMLKK